MSSLINTEVLGTAVVVLSFFGAIGKWLISAYHKSVMDNRQSPDALSKVSRMLGEGADAITEYINRIEVQVDELKIELETAKAAVLVLEQERDLWRARAIALGWIDPSAESDEDSGN